MDYQVSTKFSIFLSSVIALNFNIWNNYFQKTFGILRNNLITTDPEIYVLPK
jgi:hypothetical protein